MQSTTIELIKNSDKVLYNLAKRPKTEGKKWLAEQLGVSRPTLDAKIASNNFTDYELGRLRGFGLI